MNSTSSPLHPSDETWLPGLKQGGCLVGLGLALFLTGAVSLSHQWMAAVGMVGCLVVILWMTRYPSIRVMSWRSSLVAALVAWVPLMALYGWRSHLMASMGPKWGMVWVLAPSNEFLVSRMMAGVILSSLLAGVFLAGLCVLSYPWARRNWVGRVRQAALGSATACLTIGFASLLVWMGRSMALMGLAE